MKTIGLSQANLTVAELIQLAAQEDLVIKGPDGKEFVFAELDDFDREVETLRNSAAFMAFLAERSKEKGTVSAAEARKRLLAN